MGKSKKYSIETILGIIVIISVLCYGGFELFMYNTSSNDLYHMGRTAHNNKDFFKAKLFYRLAIRKGREK